MRRAAVASRAILACAWRDLSAGGLAPIWRHANQRRGFPCKPKTLRPDLCLAFVAGAAHAEGKTREQVRAELMEAKAAGLVTYGEQQYPVDVPDNAVKTRQQVLEERDAARAAGQITRGELDYPPVAQEAAGKTREQVIAEMRQARAQGLMKSGELDYPPTGH